MNIYYVDITSIIFAAIVFLGAAVGLFMKLLPNEQVQNVEKFSPTAFFLVLLPPIIFESGYNLHKGEILPLRRQHKYSFYFYFYISNQQILQKSLNRNSEILHFSISTEISKPFEK